MTETVLEPKYSRTLDQNEIVNDLQIRNMTLREVAQKHQISVSTVHRVRRRAGVPPHKPGHPQFKLI